MYSALISVTSFLMIFKFCTCPMVAYEDQRRCNKVTCKFVAIFSLPEMMGIFKKSALGLFFLVVIVCNCVLPRTFPKHIHLLQILWQIHFLGDNLYSIFYSYVKMVAFGCSCFSSL
eukprot:gnl/MRDRNA2_/MRDRNA2_83046_c0_seq5.p1 gnl/MRDRNA2_/MRDRNA2_83046_c0~~gnl/MRDRNA2_/MRDRNA2_83046_c0_seq5.p1  ORF type:complete len:116 (+),score=4.41 gnl/MRDRNA2_/MRDRNA2_83046_c0_seq5:137-484(+)